MMDTIGDKCKKEASLSSASAMKYLLFPSCALEFIFLTIPPFTDVGSKPAVKYICVSIAVVVVFPWVPATAIPCLNLINSASISAL